MVFLYIDLRLHVSYIRSPLPTKHVVLNETQKHTSLSVALKCKKTSTLSFYFVKFIGSTSDMPRARMKEF